MGAKRVGRARGCEKAGFDRGRVVGPDSWRERSEGAQRELRYGTHFEERASERRARDLARAPARSAAAERGLVQVVGRRS